METKSKVLDCVSIITAVLCLIVIISGFVVSYISTRDYNIELQAMKTKEIRLSRDRKIIGYSIHGRVYDRSTLLAPYVSTYEYTYNGEVFELTLRQCNEGEDSIRIYIDECNPSNYCLAEDKLSLKEFVRAVCR